MSRLDELLESYQEGRLDSQGVFTLDRERALEKLRRYRFKHPSQLVLKLVQAAVAVHAVTVFIDLSRDSVSLQFGAGVRFGRPSELLILLEQLNPAYGRPEGHLAKAIQAALGLNFEVIEWSLKQGDGCETFRVTAEGLELSQALEDWRDSPIGYRFFLKGCRTRGFAARILEACRWCPAQVFVNNVCSRDSALPATDKSLLVAHLQAPPGSSHRLTVPGHHFHDFEVIEPGVWRRQPRRGLQRLLPDSRAWLQSWDKAELSRALHCQARITFPDNLSGMSRLRVVVDGVMLDEINEELGVPGLEVEVADGVRTDLSGFGVVRDSDYQIMVGRLRNQVKEAAAVLRRSILEVALGSRKRGSILQALSDPRDSYLGMVRGSYFLVERLYEDHRSATYLALSDSRKPARAAATILRPWAADELDWRREFMQAHESLSKLDHPNVAALVETGSEPDFFRIENWKGCSLDSHLLKHEVAREQALGWAAQMLSGLAHAHQRQVHHGNLRPECLIVQDSKLVIRGFGWQNTQTTAAAEAPFLDPAYLCPEVLMGGTRGLAESDQYAAALIIYRLLVGRPPFQHRGDPMATIMAHLTSEVPDPGENCPDYEREALLRALEKAPEKRFSSIIEFAAALRLTLI